MEIQKLNRYDIESVTSKRYSIGEVLAAMKSCEDDTTTFGPPLDFSFKEIRKMSEVSRVVPRDGSKCYVTVSVSFPEESSEFAPEEVEAETEQIQSATKYSSKAVRLSNNAIASFDGFSRAINSIVALPDMLEWIDLSFNDFTKISEVLLEFKNLKVLYLHANYIDDIKQVEKLASLPLLKTLTLHGNVIDEVKGYRQFVITALPQLQYFDFSRVTRADRDKAVTWRKLKIIGHQRKRKKKLEE